MPPVSNVIASLYAAIAAAGLLVLLALYRDYRIDRLRDELFATRDELFDYAVEHNLLENIGYRHLRDVFNGMLRFCHKISFLRLSLAIALNVLLFRPEQRKKPFDEWVKMIDPLPVHQREKLMEFHLQMFVLTMQYLGDTSIALSPVIAIFRAKAAIERLFRRAGTSIFPSLFGKIERGWEVIEEQALEANR